MQQSCSVKRMPIERKVKINTECYSRGIKMTVGKMQQRNALDFPFDLSTRMSSELPGWVSRSNSAQLPFSALKVIKHKVNTD